MGGQPNLLALLFGAIALVKGHVAGVTQAGDRRIACLDAAPFAVLTPVGVRCNHGAVIRPTVLARYQAAGLYQLFASDVGVLWA